MNVVLIGMAGSGKSFIGRKLAGRLGYGFVDTDDLIRQRTGGKPFQDIIDKQGDEYFLQAEREAIIGRRFPDNTVLSPGGSVVYMPDVMEHLRRDAIVIFLDAPLDTIIERNPEIMRRGIIGLRGGKSLEDVFRERRTLYRKYANITVDPTREPDPDRLAEKIAATTTEMTEGKMTSLQEPDMTAPNRQRRTK